MSVPCTSCRGAPVDLDVSLTALYLLPRPPSVAYSVKHIPSVRIALRSLEERGTWGGLPHITLTSFSSAPAHVSALPVTGHAAAIAGTAAASRRKPYNISIGKWARHGGHGANTRETWNIGVWCPVLACITDVISRDKSVMNARRLNTSKRRAPKLHVGFGECGGKVGNADMARALAMWEWDVALVERLAGDDDGRRLKVLERWPLGPVAADTRNRR